MVNGRPTASFRREQMVKRRDLRVQGSMRVCGNRSRPPVYMEEEYTAAGPKAAGPKHQETHACLWQEIVDGCCQKDHHDPAAVDESVRAEQRQTLAVRVDRDGGRYIRET
jgi:hypothetical protein